MKILICGYIGGGNCGDEAICDRLTALFRNAGDEVRLLSLNPAESSALHGVLALPRYSPAAIRGICESDLVILGGGTLLQEETSRRSALFYLGIASLAALWGTPWVLMGGIDPLGGCVRTLAKTILPTAKAFLLRDRDSLARAKALAPSVPRFFVPDSALLPLEDKAPPREKPPLSYTVLCPKEGVSSHALASVIISARRKGRRIVWLALSREDEGACAKLAQIFGGVWVSPLHACTRYTYTSPAPEGICRKVEARTILPTLHPSSPHRYFAARPCEEACRIIAGAEEVYSARLHGLIFAKKAGTPAHILPDGTKQWKFSGLLRETF